MMMVQEVMKKVDNFVYHPNNVLGQGSSSTVYLGHSLLNNEPVAIRVISLHNLVPETLATLQNEITVLNHLPSHPNIVKIHCLLQTENHVYVVTEYC